MGLLEKAVGIREKGSSEATIFSRSGMGLLKRAEQFRSASSASRASRTHSSLFPETSFSMGHGLLQKAIYFRKLAEASTNKPSAGSFGAPLTGREFPPDRPVEIKPDHGLFHRALKFREELDLLKEQTPAGGGLLSRAEKLREHVEERELEKEPEKESAKESMRDEGLLARAESLRGEEAEVGEAEIAEMGILPAFEKLEAFESEIEPSMIGADELDLERETEREKGLLSRAEEFRGQEIRGEEVAEETPGMEGPGGEVAGFEAAEDKVFEPDAGEDFELEYEGISEPEADPGRDGHLERRGGVGAKPLQESPVPLEESPFDLWEQEAEDEAEQFAIQKYDTVAAKEKRKDAFQFDEEDLSFSTLPADESIGVQKKIDNYLALFDITKELSSIEEREELWDSLFYAIMGQMGAEKICIFAARSGQEEDSILYPVVHDGFELEEGWHLKSGDEIFDGMRRDSGVRYADEFRKLNLTPLERSILEISGANLLVPMRHRERLAGVIVLGSPMGGRDYSVDDMEFLSLLGDLAATATDRVLAKNDFYEKNKELIRRNQIQERMLSFAGRSAGVKDLDGLYDLLTEYIRDDFHADSFSLILLSPGEQEYRIFAGNRISPESIERFHLKVRSDLVGLISNLTRVYELTDFRFQKDIVDNYTNDDLALMSHFWISPLIHLNWLVGFITIHSTSEPWTAFHREQMVSFSNMIAPVFANSLILRERESIFRDPFSPLEDRLRQDLKRASEFHSPLSLVEFRVKNIKRLFHLNPPEDVAGFLNHVSRAIEGMLYDTDFMARIGQGRFAIILPGRSREEAEVFLNKLRGDLKRMRLLSRSPVDIQYTQTISSAPNDGDDPEKLLSILD